MALSGPAATRFALSSARLAETYRGKAFRARVSLRIRRRNTWK
jgi:hypothetical protein